MWVSSKIDNGAIWNHLATDGISTHSYIQLPAQHRWLEGKWQCEKCSELHVQSHISHFKSRPCYNEMLHAAYSICKNLCSPPPTAMLVFPHFKSSSFQVYFFFLSVQQPTSRLLCLALTMHAFELASPSTAFSKLRKKGSSSACFRGSLENVVNWKHPQEYGKSNMEACKNVEHIHLLLFSCIRKPSFSMSCVTEGTLRTDPCASEVTALPSETQHFISQV